MYIDERQLNRHTLIGAQYPIGPTGVRYCTQGMAETAQSLTVEKGTGEHPVNGQPV